MQRSNRKSRKYDPQTVENALAALVFAGGHAERAKKLLDKQGCPVPVWTLKYWKTNLYRDQYVYLQGVYSRSTPERLRSYNWPAIGKAAEQVLQELGEATRSKLERGETGRAMRALGDAEFFAEKAAEATRDDTPAGFTEGREVGALYIEPLAF